MGLSAELPQAIQNVIPRLTNIAARWRGGDRSEAQLAFMSP